MLVIQPRQKSLDQFPWWIQMQKFWISNLRLSQPSWLHLRDSELLQHTKISTFNMFYSYTSEQKSQDNLVRWRKTFEKVQYAFMIKSLRNLGIQEHITVWQMLYTASIWAKMIIVSGKKLKTFYLKYGSRQECSLSPGTLRLFPKTTQNVPSLLETIQTREREKETHLKTGKNIRNTHRKRLFN